MPWSHCAHVDLPDTTPCPTCGLTKAAWTVTLDATRTFRVARKAAGQRREKTAWLELDLARGAHAACEVELPDGQVVERTLDADGWLRLDGLYPGACRVRFPEEPALWVGVDLAAAPPEEAALHAADADGWTPVETDRRHGFVWERLSIREALGLPNGSAVDLLGGEARAASTTWDAVTATAPRAAVRDPASPDNPVWAWTLAAPGPGGAVVVTDLRARVRAVDFAQFQVADRLEWAPLEVTTPDGAVVRLPFEPAFFLERLKVDGAAHPGTTAAGHYWKLAAHLDQSVRLAFGYEVAGGQVRPLGAGALDRRLFPRCPAPAPEGTVVRPAARPPAPGEPLRLAVVVALTCNRERNDFEPGQVLGAGRFCPHVLVLASQDLPQAAHTLTLVRPWRTTETDAGLGGEPGLDCCGEMQPDVGPVLFTDTNERRLDAILDPATNIFDSEAARGLAAPLFEALEGKAPWQVYASLPLWNNFFDYYDLDPAPGDAFHAVTRAGPGTTGAPPQVQVLRFPPVALAYALVPGADMVQGPPEYQAMNVTKVPRQGEYDSVHMAPKMALAPDVRRLPANAAAFATRPLAGVAPAEGWKDWGLGRAAMAPFCVHDCLHTHWRWSTLYEARHNLGWRGFDPHVAAGAPQVPGNQAVRVALPDKRTQVVTVTLHGVEAGRWQVAHHQGSSYPLGLTAPATVDGGRLGIDAMASLLNEPFVGAEADDDGEPVAAADSWTMFYWRLRFGGTEAQPMERLRVDAATRAALRQHGL